MVKINNELIIRPRIVLILILANLVFADASYALRPPLYTSHTFRDYQSFQADQTTDIRAISGKLLVVHKKILPDRLVLRIIKYLLEKYRLQNNGIARWEEPSLCLPYRMEGNGFRYYDTHKDYYMSLFQEWQDREQVDLRGWNLRVNLLTRFIPADALVVVSQKERAITLYIPMESWQETSLWFDCFYRAYVYISSRIIAPNRTGL